MSNKAVSNTSIQPVTLTDKEIKEKIEDLICYDHSKYKDTEILFERKNTNVHKLPFSDFKVAIAQELDEQKLLLLELEECNLIEENIEIEEEITDEAPIVQEEVKVEDESQISVLDEIYDFDDEGKKPTKTKSRATIKQVDTKAIVEKIKAEAREKNKGKKVTTRRDINKELKPYLLKKNMGINDNSDVLTSIDIYLNAVNKIEINEIIDSSILQGLVIEYQGKVLDASLLSKQEALKEYLEK
jgi:hypothetical protein